MQNKITKRQYDEAYAIVREYKKQQQKDNFPKVLFDRITEYDGFNIVDKRTQISARKFTDEAHVVFPKIGYAFSSFSTLMEAYLIRNKLDSPPIDVAEMERRLREEKSFMVCFLIERVRRLTRIDKAILEDLVKEYSKQYGSGYKGEPRAEVIETKDGFLIVKMRQHIAFWYHNLTFSKINKVN